MAITKTRVIYSNKSIKNKIFNIISNVLLKAKNKQKLLENIKEMRQKIIENFASTNIWDLRNIKGGFVDIEFILQYLILNHCPSHNEICDSEIMRSGEKTISKLLSLGILDNSHAEILKNALKLYHPIHNILRLSYGDKPIEKEFSTEICDLLVKQCGTDSFNSLKAKLEHTTELVYGVYQQFFNKD